MVGSTPPKGRKKQRLLTVLALGAAGIATAFFATAGPVDPLRDTFFSLAIALDLLSIFLIWQALPLGTPWWLQGEEEWPHTTVRVEHPRARIRVRIRRALPETVNVLWGQSSTRFLLLLAAILAYGMTMLLFALRGSHPLVWGTWITGLILFCLAYIPTPRGRPRLTWETIGVLALLVVGWELRVYRLTDLPLQHHGDMASVGLQARALLRGEGPGWFSLGWATIPAWGFAHEALTLRLFGDSLLGLRMSAVLGGMISLLGVYALGKEGWIGRVGFLALAALTVDIVHIHFSRIPSYIDPLPWGVWGLYFLLRGYHRRAPWAWGLSGIALAVAMNMYFSGRLFLLVTLLFLPYLFIFHRESMRENREGVVVLLLGFLIGLGPMLLVILRHYGEYASRARFVLLTDPGVYHHLLQKYQATTFREVLLEQLQRTFLVFQYYGDTSTQFGWPHPMLPPLLAPFFLLGIGVATGKLRHEGNMLLSLWMITGLIVGSVLTVDAPFWPRLVVITPASALAVALGMVWLSEVGGLTPSPRRTAMWLLLFLGLIAVAGASSWKEYTRTYTAHAGVNDFTARIILTFGDRPACYVRGPHRLDEREFRFLLHNREDLEIRPERLEEDADRCAAHHGIVVAAPEQEGIVERIARMYPGGHMEAIQTPDGSVRVLVYHLP